MLSKLINLLSESELRRLKVFIQIEWSVFGIDYQRICT